MEGSALRPRDDHPFVMALAVKPSQRLHFEALCLGAALNTPASPLAARQAASAPRWQGRRHVEDGAASADQGERNHPGISPAASADADLFNGGIKLIRCWGLRTTISGYSRCDKGPRSKERGPLLSVGQTWVKRVRSVTAAPTRTRAKPKPTGKYGVVGPRGMPATATGGW